MSRFRSQRRRLGPTLCLTAVVALAVLARVAPARAGEAEDDYAVAVGHYTEQRWKLAAEEFKNYLGRFAGHSEAARAQFLLGETLLQLGELGEAGKVFAAYLTAHPGGEFAKSAEFRVGESAYLAGDFERAAPGLERFLARYPRDDFNAFVLPYLGNIALARGETGKAIEHFRNALTQFPEGRLQDDCRLGLGRALSEDGKIDEAERLLTALAGKASSPLADEAHFQLGALHYSTGRFAQAAATLEAFERQWVDSPLRSTARLGRGWALLKLERFTEAKGVFQSLSSDAKLGLEARYWFGMTLIAEEDWRPAADALLAVAAADASHPLAPAAALHAGDALLRAGDAAGAMNPLGEILRRGPEGNEWFDDALRGAMQAAVDRSDHAQVDKLAADFQRFCPESPLADDVVRLRARSLLERKQFDEAARALAGLASTRAANPPLEDAYLLAVALEGLGRYEEALATIGPVTASEQPMLKADAQVRQASILVALKRYAEAVAPLEAFLAQQPAGDSAAKARGELAVAYARTRQLDRAKGAYAELLAKHPNHALIPAATEQLAEAVYAAGDAAWAGELFARLRELGQANAPRTAAHDRDQTEIRSLSGLGWSQFKAGRYAEAEQTFDQLLRQKPPAAIEAEIALVRGQALEQINKLDPALSMYDLVIDRHPKSEQHPQALHAAARLRDRLQQDNEAAALYQQLATHYPKFEKLDAAIYEWAWVLRELGQTANADQLFERLRRDFPESRFSLDAAYRLAHQAFVAGDLKRAKGLLGEVLAGKADASLEHHARLLEGQIAVAEGDWPAVQEIFERIARAARGNEQLIAKLWIAESLYQRDRLAEADPLLADLAEKTRDQREPWMAMIPLRQAQSALRQRKWDEARQKAESIASTFPNFEQQYEADMVIGRCLHMQAKLDEAREAFGRVIRSPRGAKTETAAQAQFWIGETYFHQKNYPSALREYTRLEILYDFPDLQAAALHQAARCQELLGDLKEASHLYQRLLEKYPHSPLAKQAQKQLSTRER